MRKRIYDSGFMATDILWIVSFPLLVGVVVMLVFDGPAWLVFVLSGLAAASLVCAMAYLSWMIGEKYRRIERGEDWQPWTKRRRAGV